ncbi:MULTISPECIES: polysaccharide deacetylase family protein [unclassified Streptomyces]|uniref:polysaccharide deacetylase family protein n=1 Tax=unclassified Streptomyces TaxID=2593676 RepID=UPI0025579C79|nr:MULTISPECIES: polysaccharide deacetylase family protein [unclassified Streptomyces]WRZ69013.1 polysaccharide deacetylase family protein [Streptomyces sp. NBC_01257]WSU62962.1 polysaccharide deacetylase family protein [Streptomyces sp. NBC_01104]
MKNDQLPPMRRTLLRLAAGLGAATAVRLVAADSAGAPFRPPAPPSAAAGPQAAAARTRPLAYRLRPMTANNPPHYRPAAPPVRTRPFEHLPDIGRAMVLSFDDGPDPLYTPHILDTLRKHDVRAMFFLCGEMAHDNQDLVRRIADEGHTVGNHSWTHPLVTRLSRAGITDELGRTSEVIEKVTGAPPLWYRAPYGAWNRNSFEIGAAMGMEPMAWTVDTLDWTVPGTDSIVRRVKEGAAPGVVVLSHDAGGNRSQSVAALGRYLPDLLEDGYRITVPQRR